MLLLPLDVAAVAVAAARVAAACASDAAAALAPDSAEALGRTAWQQQ